jgi:type III restriction enzyme
MARIPPPAGFAAPSRSFDLVAHDSYRTLLEQKDALIERIIPADGTPASATPARDTTVTPPGGQPSGSGPDEPVREVHEQGTLRLVTPPRIIDGSQVDGAAALILQEFGFTEEQGQRDAAEYRILQRVPGAPAISFPRREQEILPVRFSLSYVDDADARAAGAAFAQEIRIPLIREALAARRTLDGSVQVRREAQESGEATQQWLPLAQVAADLESSILGLGLVEETLPELNAAGRVVRAFLAGAGADETTEVSWGEERAGQALAGIDALIRQKYNTRRLQPHYAFRQVTLPIEPQSMPTDIIDRFEEFERGRWYSGWRRSILPWLLSTQPPPNAASPRFPRSPYADPNGCLYIWFQLL